MKRYLLTLFIAGLSISLYATTITVSNDINRPGQYSNLQTAIDAAANGDTILVYGSSSSYGSITINKPLVLVGEGYNSTVANPATVSYIYLKRFNASLGASGTTIMGMNISSELNAKGTFSGAITGERVIDNITILRCSIWRIDIGDSNVESFQNWNIINSIIYDYMYFPNGTTNVDNIDITFHNNILDGIYIDGDLNRDGNGVLTSYQNLSGVKFYNNIFLNSTNGIFYYTYGLVFENNIFFGHELYYQDYEANTFNHNLFYLVDDVNSPGLFTNNNTGSGNLLNTDPMFVNFPSTGASFSYDHDYHLKAGSPALTASLDGGEIGIYGGAYPFEVGAAPPVPVVTEITITDGTSSVPVGGTVNFNFKAKSGN